LQGYLKEAEELDELQFHLDGLHQEKDKFDRVFKKLREQEGELQSLAEQMARFGDLQALPGDLEGRLWAYEEGKAKRERALARVVDERNSFSGYIAIPQRPIWQNPVFASTLLLGLGALGLSFGLPDFRIVALAAPFLFGASTFLALRHLNDREDRESVGRKLNSLKDVEEKAERTFELETSFIRKTMASLGVKSSADLLAKVAQFKEIKQKFTAAQEAFEASRRADEVAEAQANQDRLAPEIERIDQRLLAAGGFSMDVGDMRREIAELRELIEGGGAPPAYGSTPPGFVGMGGGSFGSPSEPPGASPNAAFATSSAPEDPLNRQLSLLADVLARSKEGILEPILPRLSQYISALSQGRYAQIQSVGRGELVVLEAAGAAHPWVQLSSADRDLCFLALKLCFLEVSLSAGTQPILLDHAFANFGAELQPLLAKMVAGLAQKTQIILQSSDPIWPQVATSVLKVEATA